MTIKHHEFAQLYAEAYREYIDTETGRKHLAAYASQRGEARQNLQTIVARRSSGEDITDAVLLKLLPYADTSSNRAAGAWISITPAVNGNLKHWFERAKWTARSDWPAIATAILTLVERCLEHPAQLAEACEAFAALPYSKGFQTGMLSPILNALNPDAFRILNNKSRAVYNYLAGTGHGQGLGEYPQGNATALEVAASLHDVIAAHALPEGTRPDDALDVFAHWLVSIRRLDLSPLKVITREQVDLLQDLVVRAFPDWTGFTDPRFIWHELEYKRAGAARAAELLSKKELARLERAGNYDEIVSRLDTVGKTTNLLYRAVPSSGDLGILYQEGLDKQSFSRAVIDLLYGPGASEERLERYVTFVNGQRLPSKWTFPTYFLFLCHPESEMFVKPSTTQWLFKTLGMASAWDAKPNSQTYALLKAVSQDVLTAFAPYGATDMIDAQSVMYTGFGYKEGEVEDGWVLERDAASPARTVGEEEGAALSEPETQGPIRYWKIAPGEGASIWPDCRDGGYIALGWRLMGDITGLDLEAFTARAKENAASDESFSAHGAQQVWQFAHDVRIGDRILANHGTTKIVGVGTVTGKYYHVTGERYPHRRAVQWEDVLPIDVNEPSWIRTLIELDRAKFDALLAGTGPTSQGLADPFSRIFTDRDEARWAFEWMRTALKGLGIRDATDPRFRISFRQGRNGNLGLRLIYGNAVPFSVNYPGKAQVQISLIEELAQRLDVHPAFRYSVPDGQPPIGLFTLAVSRAREVLPDLEHHFVSTMDAFRVVFEGWAKTPRLGEPQPEIQNALFDEALLEHLLTEGLMPQVDGYFSKETFALLEELQETPTRDFYLTNKDAFMEHVEAPLQALFADVVALLPEAVREFMETEKNVFSRILKNDFGRGGAWTWYWGALYRKGGRRIENAQLYISAQADGLYFGASTGEYSREARRRFERNAAENGAVLLKALKSTMPAPTGTLEFGAESGPLRSFEEWSGSDALYPRVEQRLEAEDVLGIDKGTLAGEVAGFLSSLFPLVLFIELDNPLPTMRRYLDEEEPERDLQPEHPLEACALATSLPITDLEAWVQAIERKGQAVLYGPPGTGKTFVARQLAQHLVGGGDGFWELVQFHPSYAYEDFVQGIRPQRAEGGGLDYPVLPGRFVRFCAEAAQRTGTCVLIIDEINRANLARVFGELMYLLEYREDQVGLAVDGRRFRIPANVRILGTMNTADRSIALVDHALRRRFAFIRLDPQYDVLRTYHREHNPGFDPSGLVAVLQRLNTVIDDPHYAVGISFFLVQDVRRQLESIWRMEIEPYLEEYFFDARDRAREFSWERIRTEVLRT